MSVPIISPESSWYFGDISREKTNEILLNEPIGTFLIRDSTSKSGFVLSVKETSKVTRYLISYSEDLKRFLFDKKYFETLDDLIDRYRGQDSVCSLVQPAPKQRLIAVFDFYAEDKDDLTIARGDILLFIIQKKEWILCFHENERKGWVPANHLKSSEPGFNMDPKSSDSIPYCRMGALISVPATAKVIRNRKANIFSPNDLSIIENEEVRVDRVLSDGICEVWHEGQKREGLVPINYLQIKSS